MSKPIPGQIYTTAQGDTLESISTYAYGIPDKWPLIKNVNDVGVTLSTDQLATGTSLLIPIDQVLAGIRQRQLNNGLL